MRRYCNNATSYCTAIRERLCAIPRYYSVALHRQSTNFELHRNTALSQRRIAARHHYTAVSHCAAVPLHHSVADTRSTRPRRHPRDAITRYPRRGATLATLFQRPGVCVFCWPSAAPGIRGHPPPPCSTSRYRRPPFPLPARVAALGPALEPGLRPPVARCPPRGQARPRPGNSGVSLDGCNSRLSVTSRLSVNSRLSVTSRLSITSRLSVTTRCQ